MGEGCLVRGKNMNTFADIYGYDKIKEHLQNAIKLNKVSTHIYLMEVLEPEKR